MKREHLLEKIKEYEGCGNNVYGYYVTYKTTENITSQKWGKINELSDTLDDIERGQACIGGELPIERLIIYSGEKNRGQCLVYVKNPMWDCVDDESEDSHIEVVVPYVSKDGWFGKIVPEREGLVNHETDTEIEFFEKDVVSEYKFRDDVLLPPFLMYPFFPESSEHK